MAAILFSAGWRCTDQLAGPTESAPRVRPVFRVGIVGLSCPVDLLNQSFMSFCATETQDLSETSKQFLEGLGEAEAGSLKHPQQPKAEPGIGEGGPGSGWWMLPWLLVGAAV